MIASGIAGQIAGKKLMLAGWIAIYILTILLTLHDYVPYRSVNFVLGIITLPAIIVAEPIRRTSYRSIIPAFLFAIIACLLAEKTFLFMALVLALVSVAESIHGKLPLSAFITILLMSPAFQYLTGVFSFPIRMKLTAIAGSIFELMGILTTVSGNIIAINGHEYTVDPACIGLKMLITSMLCGILVITIVQQNTGKYLKAKHVLIILATLFLLNIISNIFRILLLVYFNIPPERLMHDITGLVCLFVYVLAPAIWLIRIMAKRFGIKKVSGTRSGTNNNKILFLQVPLFILIVASLFIPRKGEQHSIEQLPEVKGYIASRYDEHVLQYKNETSLIYIKHINNFYNAEHNPLMCWLGSGYVFERLQETTINDIPVYTGILKKDNETLHTAWWYDNGTNRTLEQLKWRWDRLKGSNDYSVINITTINKEDLENEITSITGQNTFNPAL